MLCFLPPLPAIRPDPLPEKASPQAARAAQAVILIFVVLNILFVVTGMIPLMIRNESRDRSRYTEPARPSPCLAWSDASMAACPSARHLGPAH